MIRHRRLAVPLTAVLLALATGVALGAGPLRDATSSAAPAPRVVTGAPAASGYGDAFATSVAPRLYDRGLSRRPVAILTLPGADPSTVAALGAQIKAAGGTVTATYAVAGQLVAAQQKNLVDTLGIQLAKQLKGRTDPGLSTYPRMGELVAIAAANRGAAQQPPGDDAAAVRQSLVAGKLLTVPAGHPLTAPLLLVVLGTDTDQAIADGLLTGLAARARGVVAVGPTRDPNLAGLQTDGVTKHVTAVDGSETPAGRVAAVLGLIRAWRTPGGSFGASGADGAVPLG